MRARGWKRAALRACLAFSYRVSCASRFLVVGLPDSDGGLHQPGLDSGVQAVPGH